MGKELDRPWHGASWKLGAFACYAALNGISRYLTGGADSELSTALPVYVVVFFQDFFALLLLLPWLLKQRSVLSIPSYFPLQLFRVICSAVAIISWYFAILYMPLAEAVALSIIGPVLGVMGAKWLLKETLGTKRLGIIVGSLVMACFFLRPEIALQANQNNLSGLSFVLLASVFFALAKLATRKLAQNGVSANSLTASLLICIVPVSLVPALMNWVTPDAAHWVWLILAGGLTALAIYCVSSALVYAQVSFLAPFDICRFVLNAVVGYLAFTELPAPWVFWVLLAFVGFSVMARKLFSR